MYTIKKTRHEGNQVIYQDTYTLNTQQLYDAQIMFLDIVKKESEWMLFNNIKISIQLFKNDILKNEIKLNIKSK